MKIKKTVADVVVVIGIILILCAAGGSDTEMFNIGQALLRVMIGIILIVGGVCMGFYCVRTNTGECDGCGDCTPTPHYYCPICGGEVYETVFVSDDGTILGCENCAQIKEPHEVLENEADE